MKFFFALSINVSLFCSIIVSEKFDKRIRLFQLFFDFLKMSD